MALPASLASGGSKLSNQSAAKSADDYTFGDVLSNQHIEVGFNLSDEKLMIIGGSVAVIALFYLLAQRRR